MALSQTERERVLQLLQTVDEFGVTHIVTSDGNMDDDNLDYVEGQLQEGGTLEEYELIALLRKTEADERDELWSISVGRDPQTDTNPDED
jgi:hypothetical protein